MRAFYLFLAVFLTTPLVAHSGFVLDDFDDPAVAVSPEMENEFVFTQNVGLLNATRGLAIGGGATDPTGVINSSISDFSVLTANLSGHAPTAPTAPSLTPRISFALQYEFDVTDVTEQGTINAILLDFISLKGTVSPSAFNVLVRENSHPTDIFEAITTVPRIIDDVTLVIPFADFHFRASSSGVADFQTLKFINFRFFFFGPSADAQWSMKLDRIRFSRVPEPKSISLLLVTFCCLFSDWRKTECRSFLRTCFEIA